MSRPEISVVLPVYNGADYIESALRSLLAQDVDCEIVVSDDRSTDDTLGLIRALADPRIAIIENEDRGGQFVNFNRALAAARGPFIQLFSHDDLAHRGFLASQREALTREPRAGLVYASCNMIDAQGVKTGVADDEGTPLAIDFPLYLEISSRHGALPPSISTVMVRRAVIDAVGPFNPHFRAAGDLEFFNRVAEKFWFVRNRALLVDVRAHPGSVTQSKAAPLQYMREEIAIMPFYERHLSRADYAAMMALRERTRGADHAKYLARRALAGDFGDAAAAWRLLGALHNPARCLAFAAARTMRGR
ncbi:MAG: glycosyltransferase [Hyphomicrobiales bacterium]|nr:glycosyltransferase [Hyphomicrobiales bacterium]